MNFAPVVNSFARSGQLERLKDIIEVYKETFDWAECVDQATGNTPLHLACQENHFYVVRFISENCETFLEKPNNDSKKPLHDAAQFHHYAIVKYLLAMEVEVDPIKRGSWTPLMLACAKIAKTPSFTIQTASYLLDAGASPVLQNKDGWTPYHLAVRTGNINLVQTVRNFSEKVINIKTNNGKTVLHIAALNGFLDIVEYLLNDPVLTKSKNATLEYINLADSCGDTALLSAVVSGSTEIIEKIIEKGGRINAVNNAGLGCCQIAAQTGQVQILKYLVNKQGMNINVSYRPNCVTPLHTAAHSKDLATVEFLLQLGANPDAVDQHNRTYLDYFKGIPDE